MEQMSMAALESAHPLDKAFLYDPGAASAKPEAGSSSGDTMPGMGH